TRATWPHSRSTCGAARCTSGSTSASRTGTGPSTGATCRTGTSASTPTTRPEPGRPGPARRGLRRLALPARPALAAPPSAERAGAAVLGERLGVHAPPGEHLGRVGALDRRGRRSGRRAVEAWCGCRLGDALDVRERAPGDRVRVVGRLTHVEHR